MIFLGLFLLVGLVLCAPRGSWFIDRAICCCQEITLAICLAALSKYSKYSKYWDIEISTYLGQYVWLLSRNHWSNMFGCCQEVSSIEYLSPLSFWWWGGHHADTIVREIRGIFQISKTFLVLFIHVFTGLSSDQEDFPYSINLVWYFQIYLVINLSVFSVLVAANAIKPSQEKHLEFQKSISSISNSHRFIYLSCWCC